MKLTMNVYNDRLKPDCTDWIATSDEQPPDNTKFQILVKLVDGDILETSPVITEDLFGIEQMLFVYCPKITHWKRCK